MFVTLSNFHLIIIAALKNFTLYKAFGFYYACIIVKLDYK